MDNCRNCTKVISKYAIYCPYCGILYKNQQQSMRLKRSTHKYCKYCFATYEYYDHSFCEVCGTPDSFIGRSKY